MSKIQLLLLSGIIFTVCLTSCNKEEKCGPFPRPDTITGSVEGTRYGAYQIFSHGDKLREGPDGLVTFDPLTGETANILFRVKGQDETVSIITESPVTLEGKPFDVVLTYTGLATVKCGDTKCTGVPVVLNGKMSEHVANTRCSPAVYTFDCNIRLEFSLGEGQEYLIVFDSILY